ncbi:hypothetical protein DNH61_11180 [Paenibacillus sambharensis]|uniref:Transporter n=1 Tax=Paenibacillus sambharensis TaxID=1803190 RepID=A0A2W1L9R8_9BACL|nr:hypothetical protein [Paenibacillus sambharensis]PZD95986.1 hypothetical protein DNH61_11180 [Paenibacillus sambharensis]
MKPVKVLQIAFTYIGTVVGAGFATGQEILQFFTRYGYWGTISIGIAMILFVWLGAKMMLLAAGIGARSYEDLNKHLFGPRFGVWVSYFMMVVLFGVSAVMLAGGGAIFEEHFGIPYQTGLIITMAACYVLLLRGMNAIVTVNSVVVPFMLLFTVILIADTLMTNEGERWVFTADHISPLSAWASPFLYAAFNLSLAQAVLVPLGSRINDRRTIIAGACAGGIGIGFMLLVGHIALSTQMPGISQLAIPMGGIAKQLGPGIQWIYLFLIFAEIFTTLISDVYGLTLQLEERVGLSRQALTGCILIFCFLLSQIGFEMLLSTLYPMFGAVSLGWMYLIIRRRQDRPTL